ncbi:MAG: DUF6502 family protein [Steroidobacteraceae bacterium]
MKIKKKKYSQDFRDPRFSEDIAPRKALEEITIELVSIAMQCGEDPLNMVAAIERETSLYLQKIKLPHKSRRSSIPNDLLSRVLQRWHLDSDFLDPKGFPQLLTCFGKNSLCSLLEKLAIEASPKVVWKELVRSGAVEKVAPNRIRVLTRMLVGTRDRQITTSLATLLGTVSTIAHNLKTRDTRLLLCHRIVTDSFVPKTRLLDFAAMVERQASSALGSIDEWCENARCASKAPEEFLPIKVHFLLAPTSTTEYAGEFRKALKGVGETGYRPRGRHRILESSAVSYVRGMPPRAPRNEIVAKFAKSSRVRQ